MVYRITSGKLRLCAQASIRHDDLNNTPLHNTEWCRLRGSRAVGGLRAKASKTKTSPRPWVATHLAAHRDHDEWLPCLVKLILDCHGDMWKTRSFFAPGFVGDQSPSNFPSSLETDALIIKRMMKEDLEKGLGALQVAWEQVIHANLHGPPGNQGEGHSLPRSLVQKGGQHG